MDTILLPLTRADVATYLGRPIGELCYFAYKVPDGHKYRKFPIPKKSGGTREILAPKQPLVSMQEVLLELLEKLYRPRRCAHGFVSARSIVTNATQHVDRPYVLNVDLKDFFPTIHFGRVKGILVAYGFGPRAAELVARLACYDGRLPQGASTSPILSNMICSKLDGELTRFCSSRRTRYTRYADDLTFSTRHVWAPEICVFRGDSIELGVGLRGIIEKNGFHINDSKVRLQGANVRQTVTGLTVNEFPNVERRVVRRVRAMLHAMQKYGVKAAQDEYCAKYRKRGKRDSEVDIVEVVQGMLAFIRGVRGATIPLAEDSVYRSLLKSARRFDKRLMRKYGVAAAAFLNGLHHHEALVRAERTLRNVLLVRLKAVYGAKWPDQVRSGIDVKSYDEAIRRQSEKGEEAHGVLSYLYPHHLRLLVFHHWTVVGDAFIVNQRRLRDIIMPLDALRTEHAHSRATPTESEALRRTSVDILKVTKTEYWEE